MNVVKLDPMKNADRCINCFAFRKTIKVNDVLGGECRYYPPELGGFPVITESDWCAHHKPA